MRVRRHLQRRLCSCERSAVRDRRPPNGARCRSCGWSGGCVGIAETLSTTTRPLPAADARRASGMYSALAAVTASIFSTMAVYERGPRGRARRERVPGVSPDSPTVAAFADAGLRVPRYVVASLCKVAGSVATSQRLLLLERGRTKSQLRRCFLLLEGLTPSGVRMALFRIDGLGLRWAPMATCERSVAAPCSRAFVFASEDSGRLKARCGFFRFILRTPFVYLLIKSAHGGMK